MRLEEERDRTGQEGKHEVRRKGRAEAWAGLVAVVVRKDATCSTTSAESLKRSSSSSPGGLFFNTAWNS